MTDIKEDPYPAAGKLAAIVESSDDGIISKDLNGIVTSWNRGASLIFGYAAEEMIGRSITVLIPVDRTDEEPQILSKIRRGEKIDHYETVRQHKDGHLLDVSLSVSPILDENGNIIGASKIVRDVSRRKRADAEIAKLASIVEFSSDAIVSKDLNGIITSWNHGAQEMFGYTPEEAIGQPGTILMPPDLVDEEPGILERIRRGERIDHYETIRRHKDGTLLDISLNVSPVYDANGVIVGASKIARNITASKVAEAAMRETQIMHRLVDVQEFERHRIARDLHDHLGQQMTVLRLRIETLTEKTNGSLRTDIDEIRQIAFEIDKDIGFLSWELRPTELSDLGLEDAASSFVREWSTHYGIAASFEGNLDRSGVRLSEEFETNLYRVLQEGLNNTLKHANAKQVNVLLHVRGRHIVLMIEDDGVGFAKPDATEPASKGGRGLIGMRERAALLKGVLEVETGPGRGTTILVRIPFPEVQIPKP